MSEGILRRGLAPALAQLRLPRRLLRDPHLLLAVALTIPSLVVAALSLERVALAFAVVLCGALVACQVFFTRHSTSPVALRRPLAWSLARLAATLVLFTLLVEVTDTGGRPLVALYIPILMLAAALGTAEMVAAGVATTVLYTLPGLAHLHPQADLTLRGLAGAGAMLIVAIATRRTVSSLERALHEFRAALSFERRRSRQMKVVETVARTLASSGPSTEILEEVIRIFADHFHYGIVSIYLTDGPVFRLGAQRGYRYPAPTFDPSTGVMGRVARTRQPALVPDVSKDPDYRAGDPSVRSEISVPLLAGGDLLGVLNVESSAERPLDERDLELIVAIADHLATALLLSRERQALDERARTFQGLTGFSTAVTRSLEPSVLYGSIVDAVGGVVPADFVTLTVLDRESGRYRVRAARGADPNVVGTEIDMGEGIAGRAIRDRALVIGESKTGRDGFAHAAGIPMMREGVVVGALAIARARRAFTELEREAMTLLASQCAVAIANVFLHAEVAESAIRDPLTGLYNRRYLEAAFEKLVAAEQRSSWPNAPVISAVLFDLDHFGQFNKQHGHQTGDRVLRLFSDLLTQRFRASDLVARIGGEEFVAVLPRATSAQAAAAAEEIRAAFEQRTVRGANGEELRATVSAGCASLNHEEPTREALLRSCDVALFMAKRAGRNSVVAA